MNEAESIFRWDGSKAVCLPVRVLCEASQAVCDLTLFFTENSAVSFYKDKSTAKTWRSFAGAISKDESELLEEALVDTQQVDVDGW